MAIQDIRKLRELSTLGRGMDANITPQLPVPSGPFDRQQGPTFPTMGAMPASASDLGGVDTGAIRELMEQYKPETVATKRFADLLDHFPQHESQSIARRLLASGVGLKSGIKGAKEVMDEPFNTKMADWKEKSAPFQSAANLERYGNENARTLLTQSANTTVAQQRADEAQRSAKASLEEKAREADQKAEIERKKNDIREAVANKGEVYVTGGRIYVRYPGSEPYDSGLDAKNFSALELANLNNASRMAIVKQQGENAIATKETPSGTVTPAKEKFDKESQLEKMYRTNPRFAQHIRLTNGKYEIRKRPTDPDKQVSYDAMMTEIYPDYETPAEPSMPIDRNPAGQGGRTTDIELSGSPSTGDKEVEVEDIKTGKHFMMRASNLAKAIATKRYRQVK